MICRLLWWMAAKTCRKFLPVGQFDNEALQALVVQLFAGRVLHADAPGDGFLPRELAAEDADRTASSRPRHHIGSDKQRLPTLCLGERRHAASQEHRQRDRFPNRHLLPPCRWTILSLITGIFDNGPARHTPLRTSPVWQPGFRHQPGQKDVEIRAERPAHIGQQKVQRVEQGRMKPLASRPARFRGAGQSDSHSVPISNVSRVSGTPTRQ